MLSRSVFVSSKCTIPASLIDNVYIARKVHFCLVQYFALKDDRIAQNIGYCSSQN